MEEVVVRLSENILLPKKNRIYCVVNNNNSRDYTQFSLFLLFISFIVCVLYFLFVFVTAVVIQPFCKLNTIFFLCLVSQIARQCVLVFFRILIHRVFFFVQFRILKFMEVHCSKALHKRKQSTKFRVEQKIVLFLLSH